MRTSQKWAVGASLGVLTFLLVGVGANWRVSGGGVAAKVVVPFVQATELQSQAGGALSESQTKSFAPPPHPTQGLVTPALEALGASQRLIRTGHFTLEVEAFDVALGRLQAIATTRGGYIADLKAQRADKQRALGTVTLRVLPGQYFAALDEVRALGKVESEGIQTQDITKAYADLEARLRNKRDLESRMREILRTRTGKLSDLMEAEEHLSSVTEEIERMEGERRYYQQMTGLSTLTLELHEPLVKPTSPPAAPSLLEPLRQACQKSLEALVEAMALMILGAATLLPWAALAGIGWIVAKRLLRLVPASLPPA